MSFHKIVVSLDDSELSKAVFAQALALARSTKASLLLFSGTDDSLFVQPASLPSEVGLFSPDSMSSTYQSQQAYREQHVEAMQASLHRYYEAAQQEDVKAETRFKMGDIGTLLCAVAQDWGADLIVVGRRGRKGLSEALLGSVSNYVVHHAYCSVLVVQGATEA